MLPLACFRNLPPARLRLLTPAPGPDRRSGARRGRLRHATCGDFVPTSGIL